MVSYRLNQPVNRIRLGDDIRLDAVLLCRLGGDGADTGGFRVLQRFARAEDLDEVRDG